MDGTRYPIEILDPDGEDDGTMPANVEELEQAVVGHRIAGAERLHGEAMIITLDNGRKVRLVDDGDCCAFTSLEDFLLHPERVDHMIMGVGTSERYTKWHIYADLGDVLELTVGWSCGNPFYYGYGFDIEVEDAPYSPESLAAAELDAPYSPESLAAAELDVIALRRELAP